MSKIHRHIHPAPLFIQRDGSQDGFVVLNALAITRFAGRFRALDHFVVIGMVERQELAFTLPTMHSTAAALR